MKLIKKYLKFCLSFLSFKGRLSRKPFFLGIIALWLILIISGAAITMAVESSVEQAESSLKKSLEQAKSSLEQTKSSLKTLESAGKSAPDLQAAPAEGASPAQDPSASSDSSQPEAGAEGLKTLLLGLLIIAMLFPFLGSCIGAIAFSVRRLHDLNFSGWWLLLLIAVSIFLSWPEQAKYSADEDSISYLLSMFSPSAGYFPPALLVFNVACIILYFFVKGTKGENKYGPDPLSSP